jgi:hypothetical protein
MTALLPKEIASNKFFAVLLVLLSLPLLLNIITLPTVIIFITFGLFLWYGKNYHPFVNIIFLIIALGVYFVPIPPIGWGFYRSLKEFRVLGLNYNFGLIFYVAPLVFVSLSFRNILGNILAYFNNGTLRRTSFYLVSFGVIMVVLLAFPIFDKVRLRSQAVISNGTGDLSTIVLRQSLTFVDRYQKEDGFTAALDLSTNKYRYRLHLVRPLEIDIQFVRVETDGEKINFITDNRVVCVNCQKSLKDPFALVFPANKDIDFIFTSDRMIGAIYFTELGGKVDEFMFWK